MSSLHSHKAPQKRKKKLKIAHISETWKLQGREEKYQSICKEREGESNLVGTKRKLQDFSSRKLYFTLRNQQLC